MTRLRRLQEESTGKLRVQTGLHGDKLAKYCSTIRVICLMSVRVSCGAERGNSSVGESVCRSAGGLMLVYAAVLDANPRSGEPRRRSLTGYWAWTSFRVSDLGYNNRDNSCYAEVQRKLLH